jgi:hypothetical protein
MRAHRLIAPLVVCAGCAAAAAQGPSLAIDSLLERVGQRILEYYRRAQNVICTEKSTVQMIGWNFSPEGFARTVESELHVEADAADGDGLPEAKVVREIRKINGRPPRERDKSDRAGCTDPNPLSAEPLAFLLPTHRAEYTFAAAGAAREKNRQVLLINYASVKRSTKLELKEDPRGREDCFQWSGDVPVKGRIWVDAETYDVVRVEERFSGPVDMKVSAALQHRYNFANWVVVERYDVTIRYKTVAFHDPEEAMLLPESIDLINVMRGGLASTRRSQTFSDYRRFLTGGRVVK